MPLYQLAAAILHNRFLECERDMDLLPINLEVSEDELSTDGESD